ncbi:hypothetical protein IFR05_011769 [Cadophora sp. M221]|nr:hypothetical protein IFR05_011769 [Cadophora sp. M221]
MAEKPLSKSSPILIVGAGVFGLSTALHLGQRGYTNVTVIDKQPYDQTLYDYDRGCDGASSDINKILRCAYGNDTCYSQLALAAREDFIKWNAELSTLTNPPLGLSHKDKLYANCGTLSVVAQDGETLPPFEQASLDYMKSIGKKDTQFNINNAEDIVRAERKGFRHCIDPFNRKTRGLPVGGLLDTLGGFVYADKCCLFALHKARALGVKFVFGVDGKFKEFLYPEDHSSTVIGVRTADGVEHAADLVCVAGGGWTPTLVPELDNLCETTAGSVCSYQIPRDSPLWDRFSPDRFPSYGIGMRDGAEGGVYGFPRDENGVVKIGYRGTKYTNPITQRDGKIRSTPITRWTSDAKITAIPSTALRVIKTFVAQNLPELNEHKIPMVKSRLCWYNDSFDNHLVIDRVPGRENLMVATGGSGHGFKYLPVLGKFVVDIVEGKEEGEMGSEIRRRWQWRSLTSGEKAYNVIGQGNEGDSRLAKQILVRDEELMSTGAELVAKL